MEIVASAIILTSLMITNINPITLSLTLLILSISSTSLIFKTTTSSWLSMILIITFSSGMLTLFFYTTTLAPNEINKISKKYLIPIMASFIMLAPFYPHLNKTHSSMKFFSNYSFIMVMGLILILTLLSISTHGYNPNQSLRSSF